MWHTYLVVEKQPVPSAVPFTDVTSTFVLLDLQKRHHRVKFNV